MSEPVRPPVSKRRIVGAVVAVILAGLAVYWAIEARRLNREFHTWDSVEPTRASVDLSRAGKTVTPFVVLAQPSIGKALLLHVSGATEEADKILVGLQGKAELFDEAGALLESRDLDTDPMPWKEDELQLTYFWARQPGRYTLHLQVDAPAPALAGRPQFLVIENMLCGCMRMLELTDIGLTVLTGLPALIVGGLTLRGWRRHGWRHKCS